MAHRLALSSAGLAAATVLTPALADDIFLTMHLDYWASEHGMTFSSASGGIFSGITDGNIYATSSGTASVVSASLSLWNSGASAYTSGYRWSITATVDSGSYDIVLLDSYGDGWHWNNTTGEDSFSVSGLGDTTVTGDTNISFSDGSSRTGTVAVTPAPGAVALLALAGIAGAGGRRQRT